MTNELVRHFLIETSSKGVRLKGCPNEPYFGGLVISLLLIPLVYKKWDRLTELMPDVCRLPLSSGVPTLHDPAGSAL